MMTYFVKIFSFWMKTVKLSQQIIGNLRYGDVEIINFNNLSMYKQMINI